MSAWAKPGVKCVCVVGGQLSIGGFGNDGDLPVKGEIYTCAGIASTALPGEGFGVLIAGLPNYGRGRFKDVDFGWLILRFRPLVTRSQDEDVALFTHHLDKVGEPV